MKSVYTRIAGILKLCLLGATLGMVLLIAVHMLFFVVRGTHLLGYAYPLDYGEGPLLAQVQALRNGTPIWRLYADPDRPPYVVVNYPPVYVLAVATLDVALPGSALLAGRVVSLVSALVAAGALAVLTMGAGRQQIRETRAGEGETDRDFFVFPLALAGLIGAGLFLSIGIVREWASVMRVDMLGLCLGLWGLVIVQRGVATRRVLWAAPLFALSLLCKPTLLAAPAAAGLWLLFRNWRRALTLGLLTALLGGLSVAVLQWASGGWFLLHVVVANANAWDDRLARQFWQDHLLIMQPLMLAAALAVLVGVRGQGSEHNSAFNIQHSTFTLALLYTLFGLMTAFGIGKLGAYANYFLEAYAGLAHLAALGLAAGWNTRQNGIQPPRLFPTISMGSKVVILGLCGLALVRYYPLWSEEFLMPAGVIEGKNPARGSFGRRGVWQDLQREAFVLQARGRINAALKPLLEQAQPPLLTDVPGVAAQEGMPSRAQMFEHRMLYDQGQWDQRPLLRELANGQIDLVVLDYLGNWMTPEMIHIVTKRYAQDVSVGTYSIYRPIKIGPKQTVNLSFPYGLRLESVALTPPAGRTSYAPAEIVPVTLSWRVAPGSAEQGVGQGSDDTLEVGLRLLNERGALVLENRRLLVYAALSAADWGDAVIEHMQPISLPDELPPGSYRLQVLMRQHGRRLTAAREIARLEVADSGGQLPGETGYYFVPEAFMQAWEQAGVAGLGEPEMPAVPFNDSMLQCFEYACLRLTAGGVERAPIGEMVWLADAGFPAATISSIEQDAQLLALWESLGAEQTLGPLLGRPLTHFGYVIQYTRYARLERFLEGGEAQPGNVGRDVLRLPGDLPYRWP